MWIYLRVKCDYIMQKEWQTVEPDQTAPEGAVEQSDLGLGCLDRPVFSITLDRSYL